MCGIAGIINLKENSIHLPTEIEKMTKAIAHRGPDGEGFLLLDNENNFQTCYSDATPQEIIHSNILQKPITNIHDASDKATIALGHRRLSIIDLSTNGHQPLCSADKKIWITYNGEIYNYIELRIELEQLGHSFRTNTDTEVLINAYIEWGTDCVNKFNGMWAFVIVDLNKNEVFASRDRAGVKPFYYFFKNNLFAFASEQKALLKTSFISFEINPVAFFDFYVKGNLEYEEEGLFKNILELFPSHSILLNLKSGELKKWRYYSKPFINSSFEVFSKNNLLEKGKELEQLLIDAVAKRLRSDVAVGACLSGGIDSSLIVGIVSHLLKQTQPTSNRLKTFTATFPNFESDESHWAKEAVKFNDCDWTQVTPSAEEFIKDFEESIYAQDIPIQSASTYAQLRVMKAVKNSGVKVVLDGQGGDELFAGYHTYQISYWVDLLKQFKMKKLTSEFNQFKPFPQNFNYLTREYARFYGLSKLSAKPLKLFYEKYFADIKYLNPDIWNTYYHRLEKFHEPIPDLNNHLFNEFYNTRLKHYLKCEDRSSMWHSVESRTPFADDIPLIEFCFSLSTSYKIHEGQNKFILKEASKKYIPETILNRKDKKGYVAPTNLWMEKNANQLNESIQNSSSDYINKKLINASLFKLSGKEESMRILKIPSFAVWKNIFEKNE